MGDFNSDIKRKNKFDKLLVNFLKDCNLKCTDLEFKQKFDYTFFNQISKSWIDHIIIDKNSDFIKKTVIGNSEENIGDHLIIESELEFRGNDKYRDKEPIMSSKKIIWNDLTKRIYQRNLDINLEKLNIIIPENINGNNNELTILIEKTINNLHRAMILAASAITNESLKKQKIKIKAWWDEDMEIIYKELVNAKKAYRLDKNDINKANLKIARNAFRFKQRENKQNIENKKIKEINFQYRNSKKQFYKTVERNRNENATTSIEVDVLKKEMEKLFGKKLKENFDEERRSADKLDKFTNETKEKIFNFKLKEDKLINIMKNLSTGKAVGHSKVSCEHFKYGTTKTFIEIIKKIIETLINHDIRPNNINIGLIKPIVKDRAKDNNSIDNLRPITISDGLAIILEKILLDEIEKAYPNHPKQFGFKANSSCQHAVWVLRELVSFNKRKHKRTLICAIDASKAFDKVNRLNLWAKLINKIEPFLLRCLMNYYSVSKAIVYVGNNYSNTFETSIGVKQGGPLSPRLFCAYMEELIELLDKDKSGVTIGNCKINNMFYADDIILIANKISDLNRLLSITTEYGNSFEIKFNPEKTNCMKINNYKKYNEDQEAVFDGKVIKNTNTIKYLGIQVNEKLHTKAHLDIRIKSTIIRYNEMEKCGLESDILESEIKTLYYKTFIRPILYHGLDILNLSKMHMRSIQILESTMVKSMFNLGKYHRSGWLARSCNIESTKNRIIKLKIRFFNRLLTNELTNYLLTQLIEFDRKCLLDSNSFVGEITSVTNMRANIDNNTTMEDITFECFRKKDEIEEEHKIECRKEEVREISNIIMIQGKERTEALRNKLRIEWKNKERRRA